MPENTAIITLTESAVLHIKKIVEDKKGIGFRIAIKDTKCLGSSYDVKVVAEKNPDDRVYTQDGVTIFIDPAIEPVLKGLVLDLVNKGLGQKQLDFRNPNVVAKCGCGESFSVKKPEEDESYE
jgi:iron-sulfur cluster assembly accessory protein